MAHIPSELLAELVQSLTDANALLEDVCRAHHVHLDIGHETRQELVKEMRKTYFPNSGNLPLTD